MNNNPYIYYPYRYNYMPPNNNFYQRPRKNNIKQNISLKQILNTTSKTLNIINQAIPIINQVKPILRNAKTMFKVINIVNSKENNETKEKVKEKTEEQENTPTFFV